MKSKLLTAAALALASLSSSSAFAEADQRAVEACKAGGKAFTEIATCLPDADVAIKTLDAFSEIYPAEAAPLKTRCEELNPKDISAASTCVTSAIKSAMELKAALPSGTSIGDPIFDAVSDQERSDRLKEVVQKARSAYPDKMIWGGGLYHPYK